MGKPVGRHPGGRPRTIHEPRSVTFDIAGQDLDALLLLIDTERLTLSQLLRFIVRGYLDAHGVELERRQGEVTTLPLPLGT